MLHPFSPKYSENSDQELVKKALDGDRQALDGLIQLHQPFIYNVAWKMAHSPDDAADLTQETLIKVITKLAQFDFKSSFRTWLYRIVVNEFLLSKRRKREENFSSFEEYGQILDSIPNAELSREEEIELAEVSKEMQFRCLSGMLMCLTREQRLIYILGDTFAIDHKLGAEIFETSPQNFRVKLHRARKDLHNFMEDKCGLVNQANPCRCPKKAKTMQQRGALNTERMEFNADYKHRIADFVDNNYIGVRENILDKHTQLYQNHPAKSEFDKKIISDLILNDRELMKYLSVK